jgi:hypothetical protein
MDTQVLFTQFKIFDFYSLPYTQDLYVITHYNMLCYDKSLLHKHFLADFPNKRMYSTCQKYTEFTLC